MELIQILCTVTSFFALATGTEKHTMRSRYHKFLRQRKDAHEKCGIASLRNNPMLSNIVMGTRSVKGFYPWQVAMYYYDDFLCGGSLISKRHVITAAHCFNGISDDLGNVDVVLGEYDRTRHEGTEQEVAIKRLVVNEEYSYATNQNDIALVELAEDAKLSYYIETICLPDANEERKAGSMCWLSGWGRPYVTGDPVNILQEAEVPVVDYKVCHERNKYSGKQITERMMCIGYNDGMNFVSGCQGDSGGPLNCETDDKTWKLFGVVSWGSRVCNGLEMYTVFTKVSKYIDWIKKNMK